MLQNRQIRLFSIPPAVWTPVRVDRPGLLFPYKISNQTAYTNDGAVPRGPVLWAYEQPGNPVNWSTYAGSSFLTIPQNCFPSLSGGGIKAFKPGIYWVWHGDQDQKTIDYAIEDYSEEELAALPLAQMTKQSDTTLLVPQTPSTQIVTSNFKRSLLIFQVLTSPGFVNFKMDSSTFPVTFGFTGGIIKGPGQEVVLEYGGGCQHNWWAITSAGTGNSTIRIIQHFLP